MFCFIIHTLAVRAEWLSVPSYGYGGGISIEKNSYIQIDKYNRHPYLHLIFKLLFELYA